MNNLEVTTEDDEIEDDEIEDDEIDGIPGDEIPGGDDRESKLEETRGGLTSVWNSVGLILSFSSDGLTGAEGPPVFSVSLDPCWCDPVSDVGCWAVPWMQSDPDHSHLGCRGGCCCGTRPCGPRVDGIGQNPWDWLFPCLVGESLLGCL